MCQRSHSAQADFHGMPFGKAEFVAHPSYLARSGQSGVFFEGGIKSLDPEHRLHTACSLLD
jgi:hypothetical protein